MTQSIKSKLCKNCNQVKNVEEFNRFSQRIDGRHYLCKICYRQYHKQARITQFSSMPLEELKARHKNNSIQVKRRNAQIKVAVLSHYSKGYLQCANPYNRHTAPITDIDILTLDHINGGGSRNQAIRYINKRLYARIRKENYPEGYQVLCCNCQSQKRIRNKECGINRKPKTKVGEYNTYYYNYIYNTTPELKIKKAKRAASPFAGLGVPSVKKKKQTGKVKKRTKVELF